MPFNCTNQNTLKQQCALLAVNNGGITSMVFFNHRSKEERGDQSTDKRVTKYFKSAFAILEELSQSSRIRGLYACSS